jgi:hypothetical protein
VTVRLNLEASASASADHIALADGGVVREFLPESPSTQTGPLFSLEISRDRGNKNHI